ncbi:MAG: adenylyltransferase/cytidyltransferase family protein [Candidatus Nanohaloarchaea archaeon]
MARAVYVGRFQPFHLGHFRVVDEYREEFDEFVMALGSADKRREEDNPLTVEERKDVIHQCFPGLHILGIEDEGDTEEDNRQWAEKLEEKTGADVVLSQNELVKRLVEEYTDMELLEHQLFDPEVYSGTEIRRRIRSDEEWRYLVAGCAEEKIEEYREIIRKSGIQYDFNPGWKKENASHGTAD